MATDIFIPFQEYTCGCTACGAQQAFSHEHVAAAAPSSMPGAANTYSAAVTGLSSGNSWSDTNITYTFASSEGHFGSTEHSNYQLFNSAQQATTQSVLSHIEDLVNITFTNNGATNPDNADIVFRQAELAGNIAGEAYYPSDFWGSDVHIHNDYDTASDDDYYGLNQGAFGYRLFLHEIGHAMGLKHPHDSPSVSTAADSQNATVMSYNASSSSSTGGSVATLVGPYAPQTYMLYDIATLQELYGANTSYNSGNTTYTLTGEDNVHTIWDGGGTDTLSALGYSNAVVLDIREGLSNVSSVGGTYVWVAFNADIENATGGNGHDTITGNDLANELRGMSGNDTIDTGAGADFANGNAGNDTIDGGAGDDRVVGGRDADSVDGGSGNDFINGNRGGDVVDGGAGNDSVHGGKDDDTVYGGAGNDVLYGDLADDVLYGDSGADIFYFRADSGVDTIADFEDGTDSIQLNDLGFSSSNILTAINYVGTNAEINLGGGNSITVTGMTNGTLTDADFIFS